MRREVFGGGGCSQESALACKLTTNQILERATVRSEELWLALHIARGIFDRETGRKAMPGTGSRLKKPVGKREGERKSWLSGATVM